MSMDLLTLFRQHATPAIWVAYSRNPQLREDLERLLKRAPLDWPEIQLPIEQFVSFLARHLPLVGAQAEELSVLRGNELYLVCAYGLGDEAAYKILEAQYMPKVHQALVRLSTPPPLMSDIEQELRHRLIEMHDPSIQRRGYSGRSGLAGWLCLSAIRAARLRLKRGQRERPLEQAALMVIPGLGKTAETDLLTQRYKEAFQSAFAHAIAALSARERNLLRYHFLMNLSIDQVAPIYGVHRATVARWIGRAQERLVTQTRQQFLARVPESPESLVEVMELIQSQLSLNLGRLLESTAELEEEVAS